MVTQTAPRPIVNIRPLRISTALKKIYIPMPSRRALVNAALIIGGISIPALMLMHILPLSLPLAFIGLALTATGCVLALVCCGEL